MLDLIERLRALSRHEHSDMTIGDEAADALEAARAEVERLNRILGRIVAGDGDSTVRIRWSIDAFDAAREYLYGKENKP